MKGINKAIVVGTLGKDPETRYSAGGAAITTISVATNEEWKDKQTGEKQSRTEWHRVKFFGRLAEIAGEYLRKGSQVYIEGSLRTDKYTDKEGIDRYSTDIIASELQMLGGKGDGQRSEESSEGERSRQQQRSNAAPPRQNQAPARQPDDFEDDEIPFD